MTAVKPAKNHPWRSNMPKPKPPEKPSVEEKGKSK